MTRKVVAVLFAVLVLGACEASKQAKKGGETANQEQEAVQTGFNRLNKSQQIPTFDWSQERQTLIDIETLRAVGAETTSVGYLEGVGLIWWCPSLGAPVPSTYQLSGSTQYVDLPGDHTRDRFSLEQGEPTGVYVGESSGTWTICLDDNGRKFGQYWEGYVSSTTGTLGNLPADKRVVTRSATFKFTEKPK